MKVRRLQVGFLKEARCEGAYFQFSDSVDDPDDETTGRYCGHVTGNATRYIYSHLFRLDPRRFSGGWWLAKVRSFAIPQAISTTRSRSNDHPVVGRAVRLGASGHLFRSILHPADPPGGRASSRLLRVHVANVSCGVHHPQRAQDLQTDLAGLSQRLSAWD